MQSRPFLDELTFSVQRALGAIISDAAIMTPSEPRMAIFTKADETGLDIAVHFQLEEEIKNHKSR